MSLIKYDKIIFILVLFSLIFVLSLNSVSAENITLNDNSNYASEIDVNSVSHYVSDYSVDDLGDSNSDLNNDVADIGDSNSNDAVAGCGDSNLNNGDVADIGDFDSNDDVRGFGDFNQDNVSSYSVNAATFTDLQNLINNANSGDTLNLNSNYSYSSSNDYSLRYGVVINKNLIINGNGHTIDGNYVSRIFDIWGIANVNLINLNFINAYSDSYAGALSISSSSIQIANCNFTNNKANSAWGGAISSMFGTIFIKDSNFLNNIAKYEGAAIYASVINATNCKFLNNKLTDNSESVGGAISASNEVYAKTCTFVNNSAFSGAAIYASAVSIANSILVNNQAQDSVVISANSLSADSNYWGTNAPKFDKLANGKNVNNWIVLSINGADKVSGGNSAIYELSLNKLNNGNSLTGDLPNWTEFISANNGNIVNNKVDLINGLGFINYSSIDGSFDLLTAYDEFNSNITYKIINVGSNKTILTGSNLNKLYKDNQKFNVTLTDEFGNPIAGRTVAMTLMNSLGGSKTYYKVTDVNGVASLDINLNSGNYTIDYAFMGDSIYNSSSGFNSVSISKICGILTPNLYNESFGACKNFTVLFKTSSGDLLIGRELSLTLINIYNETKTYWRTTNTEGIAKLTICLIPNTWHILCEYSNLSFDVSPALGTIIVNPLN